MLKLLLKRWTLTPLLLLLLAATPFFLLRLHTEVQASQLAVTGSHHYFYDFPNGTMNVYDIDNNFALVQSGSIPTTNVRGVVFDPQSGMLYFSDGGNGGANGTGSLIKYNLVTQSVVYKQAYNFGVDSFAITPDGKTIYMPDGSASSDGIWHSINTASGQVTGSILTASGVSPHDTDMSANGQYVYMEGVNSNVLWVASTATGQIVQKVQPFAHAIRPFVVNQSGTLAYATENGLIGFGVGNLQTGQVLYNVSAPGFNLPPGFNGQYVTPSHGISLSPDGRIVYVVDMPNNYVHVFNVSGLPNSAPTMTASIPVAPISGTESPCAIDCAKEGWLIQSIDGRYLFVGNSGSIIDTTTNKVVANLATLSDTRMYLEVDWVNGVPTNSEDRTDFYWNSGPRVTPTATPTPVKKPTPTATPTKKGTPTATATRTSLGTGSQAPPPTGSSKPTQQTVAQTSSSRSEQSGSKRTGVLITGGIFVLLAAAFFVLIWRRRARKRAAHGSQPVTPLHAAMPDTGSFNPVPSWGVAPPAQPPSSGPGWGTLPDQPTSPSLPEVNHKTNGNQRAGLLSAAHIYSSGKMPEVSATRGVPGSGGSAATPNTFPTAAPQSSDLLQDLKVAANTQPTRKGLFIQPGKIPPDAP